MDGAVWMGTGLTFISLAISYASYNWGKQRNDQQQSGVMGRWCGTIETQISGVKTQIEKLEVTIKDLDFTINGRMLTCADHDKRIALLEAATADKDQKQN